MNQEVWEVYEGDGCSCCSVTVMQVSTEADAKRICEADDFYSYRKYVHEVTFASAEEIDEFITRAKENKEWDRQYNQAIETYQKDNPHPKLSRDSLAWVDRPEDWQCSCENPWLYEPEHEVDEDCVWETSMSAFIHEYIAQNRK